MISETIHFAFESRTLLNPHFIKVFLRVLRGERMFAGGRLKHAGTYATINNGSASLFIAPTQ